MNTMRIAVVFASPTRRAMAAACRTDLFRYRTAVTNENGDTTWYSYDDDGYVVQELFQDRTMVSSVWQNGLRQSVTDAYGQTERLWYNAKGDLVLEEDPEGGAKVFAYTTFTPSTPFSELDWSIDVGKRPDDSTPGVLAIDFDDYTIDTFGTGGSTPNNYEVLDDGYTLRLWGDTWKAIPIADYSITANTILEFDFTSSDPGDRHCIGLDDDASFNWPRQFMLYGTGGQAGVTPRVQHLCKHWTADSPLCDSSESIHGYVWDSGLYDFHERRRKP